MSLEQAIALIKKQDLATEVKLVDELFIDLHDKLTESDPPEWHKTILDSRLADLKDDKNFQSWEKVKNRILNGADR